MTAIFPVPTYRISDAVVTRRMLSEFQYHELDLLRAQTQVSTGRQYSVPSEDPASAVRAISLQRLLEQKQQIQTNLETGQSFLNATDSATGAIHSILADVRGLAISATGDTADDQMRLAASLEIGRAVEELMTIGNQSFRGRNLFAGSLTDVTPFAPNEANVQYNGNRRQIQSFSDLDMLFGTNLTGDEVFGVVSPQVVGTADLTPRLTEQTRLADLQGGHGVAPGGIVLSDGTNSRTIDVRNAETIGDLVRLIESSPPAGRVITADVAPTGLVIGIDAAGGGNLTVREVGGGHTAEDLGILRTTGAGTAPIVGEILAPQLTLTSRLDDVLGVRAEATLASPGVNNDLIIQARDRGTNLNGTAIRFVDDSFLHAAPLTAGSETVTYADVAHPASASVALSGPDNDLILTAVTAGTSMNGVSIVVDASSNMGNAAATTYDPATKTLTINIDDNNETTLGTLVGEIDAGGVFTAAPDPSNSEGYDPLSPVNSADAGLVGGTTAGGAEAGTLLIRIDPGHTTANDVITAIEAHPVVSTLFSAQTDEDDTSDPANAGTGKVSLAASATMAGGSGIELDQSSGIEIQNGGHTHILTFENAETVEDLLNVLNGSEAGLWAEISEDGTGINLFSRLSGSDFQVGENGGTTATDLGIRSLTLETRLADLNHGLGVASADGTDFTVRRRDGVVLDIDVSSAATVRDVFDLINNHPDNLTPTGFVTAQFAPYGNGITLVEDNPLGPVSPLVFPSFGDQVAARLGLATSATATVQLTPPANTNTGFVIGANAPGTALNDVEVVFSHTLVGDVANVNFDAAAGQLLVEIDPAQTQTNTILGALATEGTFSAWLETDADPTNDGTGIFSGSGMLARTGGALDQADPNPLEVEGVFNTLVRLSEAIQQHDLVQIERTVGLLDEDMERARFAQAESGAQVRSLDILQQRLADEKIELNKALSLELDVDLVAAVSDLTARQAAFEASLRSTAQIFHMSLLNYL